MLEQRPGMTNGTTPSEVVPVNRSISYKNSIGRRDPTRGPCRESRHRCGSTTGAAPDSSAWCCGAPLCRSFISGRTRVGCGQASAQATALLDGNFSGARRRLSTHGSRPRRAPAPSAGDASQYRSVSIDPSAFSNLPKTGESRSIHQSFFTAATPLQSVSLRP